MLKIRLILFIWSFSLSSAFALEVGDPAPECSKGRLFENNQMLDIQSYQGKVVYLDFWATWCPPCKKSMPFLNALRNEFQEQGFEVVAISVDEDPDDAKVFLQQYPVDYVVASEPSGECPKQYDVKAMPASYFIDRKGVIRTIHLGFRSKDEEEIRQRVVELLGEKT